MIKFIDAFGRKPETTFEQFSTHYANVHAGIARNGSLHQIARYVQNHRIVDAPNEPWSALAPWAADAAAEVWFASGTGVLDMIAEPTAKALLADEANFMDMNFPRHPIIAREHGDGGSSAAQAVKVQLWFRRRPGTDFDEFADRIRSESFDALSEAVGANDHVINVRDSEFSFGDADVERADEDGESFDAVRELWFPDLETISTAAKSWSSSWAELIAPSIIDTKRSHRLVVVEKEFALNAH